MPVGVPIDLGAWGWWVARTQVTLYEVSSQARLELEAATYPVQSPLRNADVVMLDESLGALDPQNFRECLDCVTRRAKTLLVVAHS